MLCPQSAVQSGDGHGQPAVAARETQPRHPTHDGGGEEGGELGGAQAGRHLSGQRHAEVSGAQPQPQRQDHQESVQLFVL